MATMVYVEKERNCMRCVGNEDRIDFVCFKEGYVRIDPWIFMDIHDVAEFVAGCFEEGSNFERVLKENFKCEGEFKGIKFEFNDIRFTVTKENADYDKIVKDYFERFGE